MKKKAYMFCIRFSTFVFFLIVLSILLFSVINPSDSTWGFVGAELRVKVCFVLLNKWHILSRPAQCNYSDVIFSQTRMSSTKLLVSVLLCSCLWLIFFQKRKEASQVLFNLGHPSTRFDSHKDLFYVDKTKFKFKEKLRLLSR